MTLFRLLTEGSRALEQSGVPNAGQDARQMLLAAFHLDMVHFLLNRMQELEDNSYNRDSISLYRDMIGRRRRRCPLQQILGSQMFMGLEFYVNRHVLIPRQDTETLVEMVLADEMAKEKEKKKAANADGRWLLDLCTGSGCIAISLAAKGDFTKVTVADISKEALDVARKNAGQLLVGWDVDTEIDEETKTNRQFEFRQGDLFAGLSGSVHKYQVITANPPYIPTAVIATLEPEVKDYEPSLALDGTEDGLEYYRRIVVEAGEWLDDRGTLYLEIGHDQKEAVTGLLDAAGYENIRVRQDMSGHDRVVAADRFICHHI